MRLATLLLALALVLPPPAAAQGTPRDAEHRAGTAQGTPQSADEQAVRTAVLTFLDVLGNRQLDKLPALFAPKATMVVVRQRDGQWATSHQTFEEWLAGLKAQPTGTTFREPLTNVTVHVESGQLAFVRADFTVITGGRTTRPAGDVTITEQEVVRSHGVDYFTLVKDGGAWKLTNASYTSIPGPAPQR